MEFLVIDPVLAGPPDFVARHVAGLWVRDGRIARIFESAPRAWPDAPLERMPDGVLMPGFCDAHVHALSSAVALLSACAHTDFTLAEVSARVDAAARAQDGAMVRVSGYDESRDPAGRTLTRELLDRLVPDRPVAVLRVDLHSCWVNTRALERLELAPGLAGVEEDISGHLRGPAFYAAGERMRGWVTRQERAAGLAALGQYAAAHGVTSLHGLEGAPSPDDPERQEACELLPGLPIRTRLYLQCFDVSAVAKRGLKQIGGCLLLDGSLGSHTAALDGAYADEPGTAGLLYHEDSRIEALIRRADDRGMQCAFHAIGPRAIEQVLAAYERVLGPRPRRDHRHRIEHFLVPRTDQIERAAALGLGLGVQPTFHHLWGGSHGMYAARLGPERVQRVNPLQTLLRAGLVLGGSSDSDVTPLDPLLGVRAALTHPVASERLTVAQALGLWITGSRWLGFEEDAGRLAEGQRADLVLLGRDPIATPPGELDHIPVLGTWVEGRRVWDPAASSDGRVTNTIT